MKTSTTLTGGRLAVLALAAGGALALAGCENPQPTAAPEQPTAAPPPGDAALMGAPTTRTPQYVGPAYGSPPPAPSYGPPPPPPAPNGYAPGYPPPAPYPANAYPPGYGHQTGPGAPGEIVAMAPIPNPPEHGEYYGRHYGPAPHRRHHVWIYGGRSEGYGPAVRPRRHPAYVSASQAAPAIHHPVAPSGAVPAATTTPGQLATPGAPLHRHRHMNAATAAAASGGPVNATAPANASEADRYKALESSLHDAFESVAVLSVPSNMPAGQASTVTLTLPAEFAAAVQRDAAQQGLQDAAASMNLIAGLSGDGYTVTPVEPQTAALTANQPVSFSWQVTPGTGAKGPLKASVRAQVVSAGQYLNLGDKSAGDTMLAGKVVGIGLLVLIAALILGWAFRRKPARPQTVVRRPAYDQYPTVPPRP